MCLELLEPGQTDIAIGEIQNTFSGWLPKQQEAVSTILHPQQGFQKGGQEEELAALKQEVASLKKHCKFKFILNFYD